MYISWILIFSKKNKGNHIQNKQFYNDTFFFNLDKKDESVVVEFIFGWLCFTAYECFRIWVCVLMDNMINSESIKKREIEKEEPDKKRVHLME